MLGSQRTKENNFDQLEDNSRFPKEEYFSVFHHDAKLAKSVWCLILSDQAAFTWLKSARTEKNKIFDVGIQTNMLLM